MQKKPLSMLSSTRNVGSEGALSIRALAKRYGAVYHREIVFDLAALGLKKGSWFVALLRDFKAESEVSEISATTVEEMRSAIELLVDNPSAKRLLNQSAKQTTAADIRRLFQLSEELVTGAEAVILMRARASLRSFFFTRAHTVCFAEPMDAQRVRFKPKLPLVKGNPRPLLSDLHDITDPNANLPIGALAATTAKQITNAVKERAEFDLQRIRTACIVDMTAAAALRLRAKELRDTSIRSDHLSRIRRNVPKCGPVGRDFPRFGITADIVLIGMLKIIHTENLATSGATIAPYYYVPMSRKVRAIFLDGIAAFTSDRLLEIEYRACTEELFAAFQLLQTYLGWNWDSVSSLQADQIDLSTPGVVALQSSKSKTDDDTPVCSIDLSEPGVQMAIDLMRWNLKQLVECGFINLAEQRLWSTRTVNRSKQRYGYICPINRLEDFIKRHTLPKYTFEQVRAQVLFCISLTKGGIEAARLQGGHTSYGTTQRYVGNIVQDRISSALNLEFSKRLEAEIHYLYCNGTTNAPDVTLLKPIGDGSSCINPEVPPPGRSRTPNRCTGKSCHANGGCPNRRIAIDDSRVEEVLRLHLYYTRNWQRLMQANPEEFALHTMPRIAFNAALLLALQRGPYATRVRQLSVKIGMS